MAEFCPLLAGSNLKQHSLPKTKTGCALHAAGSGSRRGTFGHPG